MEKLKFDLALGSENENSIQVSSFALAFHRLSFICFFSFWKGSEIEIFIPNSHTPTVLYISHCRGKVVGRAPSHDDDQAIKEWHPHDMLQLHSLTQSRNISFSLAANLGQGRTIQSVTRDKKGFNIFPLNLYIYVYAHSFMHFVVVGPWWIDRNLKTIGTRDPTFLHPFV